MQARYLLWAARREGLPDHHPLNTLRAYDRALELHACNIRNMQAIRSYLDIALKALTEIGTATLDEACLSGSAPADLDAGLRLYGAPLSDLHGRLSP